MRPALVVTTSLLLCLLPVFAQTAQAREHPVDPPEPMAGQATDMALNPFPVRPRTGIRLSLAAGLLGSTSRGEASYHEYQALASTVSGWYGMSLPWNYLRQFAVGLEIRSTTWLWETVSVPPAISERHQRFGLGTMRLALSAQILDSTIWTAPTWWRFALSVWVRASVPSTTLVLDRSRYPKIPWLEALGPAARNSRAAILELAGVTGLMTLWQDRFAVRLSWNPLVWGLASGTQDRFFTNLHLGLSGRPWWVQPRGWALRGVELLSELGLFAAYNEPVYTGHVNAATMGMGLRLWFGRMGLEAGFRYGFGTTILSHGQIIGELSARFRFASQQSEPTS